MDCCGGKHHKHGGSSEHEHHEGSGQERGFSILPIVIVVLLVLGFIALTMVR
ncbi:hypothetical protein J4464_04440 [Candidatus Woesearchaeota archaeon]|nr:hypothetical protein [Candidatus Woesearchaeota archaeon]